MATAPSALAVVERGWSQVFRIADALGGQGKGLATAAAGSTDEAIRVTRFRADAARLESLTRSLTLAIADYERISNRNDRLRLLALTAMLLLGFAVALANLTRRTLELRRQKSRAEQLAIVAQHAASAVVVADAEGRVLWVNRAFHTITGWDLKEIAGHEVLDVLVDEATARLQHIAGAIRTGYMFRDEVRMRARDGQPFWGALEIVRVPGGAGREARNFFTFHDATESHMARADLAASEARFRSALDAMAEGLVIQDTERRVIACNSVAERILGLTQGQLAGHTGMPPGWQVTREDGTELPTPEYPTRLALRTGLPVTDTILGVHRPDGSHVWVSIESNVIRDTESEQVTGVVTTFLDITARRLADEQLRRLKQAVEQSPTACMITNARRELEYVNPCFERMTGWKAEDVLGRTPRLLASGHTPADTYSAMWTALGRGERWQGELVNHRRDGTAYRSRMVVFPLKNPKGDVTHYVAFSEDVTEEHRRARELAQAREESLAAARAKSEFLQNMSHELRTPMNGILGMSELLQQSELTSAQRADLATLRSSADQLLTVISQLFDFARMGEGAADQQSVAFQLAQAIAPVRDKLAGGAESRGLNWGFELAPGMPQAFRGDPGGLRQVLLHLVDNALKFTSRGSVVVKAAAERMVAGRWYVRFEVHDTGIGIPLDRQAAIFEAFEQADGSSTRRYGGIGLGLTLARLIVARMGGQLLLTSEPGQGSTFAFSVPLEPLAPGEATLAEALPAPVTGTLAGARIVLVDGGGSSDRLLAPLVAAGAKFDTVPGPEGALALVREATAQAPVRAILLDERGGNFDAFPVARRLREALGDALPPLVFIAVTGQRGDAERCHELGIAAYLTHPVSDADLREALEQAIAAPPAAAGDARPALVTRHVLRERRRAVRLLLVEDNAVNRKVATRLLERSGFVVQVAENGRDGFERFREGGWDVVLMDMQMPVMDGLQSTRAIRAWEAEQQLPRTPIVAVTAHTLDDDRAAAFEAGMDGFVGKPIVPDELLKVIASLVRFASEESAAESGPPALAEVLDWDEALERMDGDEAVLLELLRLFLQDMDHMVARLEEACASGDLTVLVRAAHGLKGASATISARAVAPLAREVEELARQGDGVQALDRMQELRVEMQRLRRALEALPEPGRRAA
ncbi:MAG: PAS domain S-box protein [Candidatus Eisenbacteria bacterium]